MERIRMRTGKDGARNRDKDKNEDKFRDKNFERVKIDQVYLKEKNKNRHT
jgi:hypothetical protein